MPLILTQLKGLTVALVIHSILEVRMVIRDKGKHPVVTCYQTVMRSKRVIQKNLTTTSKEKKRSRLERLTIYHS